ncbi:putative inactive purple acid phosphatase 9 [Artemisia annua]|uniref:Putative inactive purple acid phosphatase 9 n=1 Tax=Artemisia annua TaxID=35608 RepID=A0A2U1L5Q0_ARTAN|nr:putative inactive purple acid phosphatase 9 [Artemisia annua]
MGRKFDIKRKQGILKLMETDETDYIFEMGETELAMVNYEVGLVQKGLIFSPRRILGRFRLPVAAVGGAAVVLAVAVGRECASTVKREDMCHAPANSSLGWRDPGFIHDGVMVDLEPGKRYFYENLKGVVYNRKY